MLLGRGRELVIKYSLYTCENAEIMDDPLERIMLELQDVHKHNDIKELAIKARGKI